MSELDAILKGEEVEAEETPVDTETSEAEAEEMAEQQDEATGDDKDDSTPESKEAEKEPDWSYKAYKDEKQKRQELERELEALRKPKEPVKAPDIFEDQEAYNDYVSQQIQETVANERANTSQFLAEREFGKEAVQDGLQKFESMIKDNPTIKLEVLNSPSPYHAMMDLVEKAEKVEAMSNIEDWEAKKEAEIEAKVRAKIEAEIAEKEKKLSSVTPSLNTQASKKGGETNTEGDSLAEILGR